MPHELTTPVYVKSSAEMPWPADRVFYLLTGDGLYLCRNHDFFRSSVRARSWPRELSCHKPSLVVRYPPLPRSSLEQVVAFFGHVGWRYRAEAIVLLAWDARYRRVRVVVPYQVAVCGRNRFGDMWPIGVEYDMPEWLPADWSLFGDIHSHVDGPAYASHVDREDEAHRPGLHVVVGRVFDEPPEFSVQAVVDGCRFPLSDAQLTTNYTRRSPRFPRRWLQRFTVTRQG